MSRNFKDFGTLLKMLLLIFMAGVDVVILLKLILAILFGQVQ